MKAKDIRKLSAKQIDAKIADLKEELFNLKFQAALGNLETPARMKAIMLLKKLGQQKEVEKKLLAMEQNRRIQDGTQ